MQCSTWSKQYIMYMYMYVHSQACFSFTTDYAISLKRTLECFLEIVPVHKELSPKKWFPTCWCFSKVRAHVGLNFQWCNVISSPLCEIQILDVRCKPMNTFVSGYLLLLFFFLFSSWKKGDWMVLVTCRYINQWYFQERNQHGIRKNLSL